MFEKAELKAAYINAVKKKLEKAKISYEVAKNDTIEAEGRMVTRYDSSKTETAWLADGRLKEVKELEQCIDKLEKNEIYANISDIVLADLIMNKEYQKTEKFVLSRKGRQKVSDKLLQAFIGCMVGDIVTIEEGRQYLEYQVREVQKGEKERTASIESVVTLSDKYGEKEIYYIVNYVGGMEIVVNGESVFCISKQSPLAKALLGKELGESVIISKDTGAEMLIDKLE